MKRLHILNKPTSVKELKSLDLDKYNDSTWLKAEKLQARRWKKFKQQLA
ncbi:MAG: hypothetical protein WC498_02210 [Candidatus Saccharimonadales bacterium]